MQNQRFLRELQQMVGQWSRDNFGEQPSYRPLLGVAEETGELCHAHLKGEQGIRHTPEEIRDLKIDAIGDIIIYLADYCEREGISLATAVEQTWSVVEKRIWDAAKKTKCSYIHHKGLPGEGRCPLKKGHKGAHRGPFDSPLNQPTNPSECGRRIFPDIDRWCRRQKGHDGDCLALEPGLAPLAAADVKEAIKGEDLEIGLTPRRCGKRLSPNIDLWCQKDIGHVGDCSGG